MQKKYAQSLQVYCMHKVYTGQQLGNAAQKLDIERDTMEKLNWKVKTSGKYLYLGHFFLVYIYTKPGCLSTFKHYLANATAQKASAGHKYINVYCNIWAHSQFILIFAQWENTDKWVLILSREKVRTLYCNGNNTIIMQYSSQPVGCYLQLQTLLIKH